MRRRVPNPLSLSLSLWKLVTTWSVTNCGNHGNSEPASTVGGGRTEENKKWIGHMHWNTCNRKKCLAGIIYVSTWNYKRWPFSMARILSHIQIIITLCCLVELVQLQLWPALLWEAALSEGDAETRGEERKTETARSGGSRGEGRRGQYAKCNGRERSKMAACQYPEHIFW